MREVSARARTGYMILLDIKALPARWRGEKPASEEEPEEVGEPEPLEEVV